MCNRGLLEDAQNGLSAECRAAIHAAKEQSSVLIKSVRLYDDCLEKSASAHPDCKKLLKLEGVGMTNAVNLYFALGFAEIGKFKRGRDTAVCIGFTPIQKSSGEKVKLGLIGKYTKNSILKSQLIYGAMATICHVVKGEAKT